MTLSRITAVAFRSTPRTLRYVSARKLHTSRALWAANEETDGGVIDGLADGGTARGRTGGGKPLGSSSENAPPKPKITNASVAGNHDTAELTEEQRKEVEEHNREFDERHDRGNKAPDDKVDKKFWSGEDHERK